jgi:hypothetical protein
MIMILATNIGSLYVTYFQLFLLSVDLQLGQAIGLWWIYEELHGIRNKQIQLAGPSLY